MVKKKKVKKVLASAKDKSTEKLQGFFKDKVTSKDLKTIQKIGILIIFLILGLIALDINKAESYRKYERVEFTSAGATLFANLYYPSKALTFQDKRPLIIFCHGIGSQRDFDLRIPIEFTKRGFYVAALDYQGHGESGGNINNIDQATSIPALAQDCTKLLEKLKTLPFYTNVNTSQIGLIGHSLGGMVVLMNQALNPEFLVTVALAPLVNFTPPQYGLRWEGYEQYIPANLINTTNTENLLIIMHKDDEALDFTKHAVKAQELTNCTLYNITQPLLGGGHQLFSYEVIVESINWFELHFFNSEVINGPITITYIRNYVLIFINLGLLLFIVFLLISYSSQFFKITSEPKTEDIKTEEEIFPKRKKIFRVIQIAFYSSAFIINWQLFASYFGLIGIFYASFTFSSFYGLVKITTYLIRFKKQRVESYRREFLNLMKEELEPKVLIYSLICAWYFIIVYLIFSFYYPFGFMWPSNIINVFISFFFFPIYFSIELLFRRFIYPHLDFIKTEKTKARITTILAFIIYVNMMILASAYSYLPSVLFTFIILLMVTIFNTIIYRHTRRFSAVLLSSFNIIQLFFSAVISNVIGVGTVFLLF